MKLDLVTFFQLIENESYVIIKPSKILPEYEDGSDIDIFCYHPQNMVNKVISFLSKYVNSESTISIVDGEHKIHIDYIYNGKIQFRFDLYKYLPKYKNINLKSAFFSSVIENAEYLAITEDVNSLRIKVPSMIDDFILRYVEYHEYYAERPDKIKHIQYIEKFIPKDKFEAAFDKLHYYTAFPKPEYRSKSIKEKTTERVEYYQSMLIKAKHLYKTSGFKPLFSKIVKKLG